MSLGVLGGCLLLCMPVFGPVLTWHCHADVAGAMWVPGGCLGESVVTL